MCCTVDELCRVELKVATGINYEGKVMWKYWRHPGKLFQTQRGIKTGQVIIWLFSIQEVQNYYKEKQLEERRHSRGQQMAAFASVPALHPGILPVTAGFPLTSGITGRR